MLNNSEVIVEISKACHVLSDPIEDADRSVSRSEAGYSHELRTPVDIGVEDDELAENACLEPVERKPSSRNRYLGKAALAKGFSSDS
ncbi:MAG: hypothetical protein HKN87_12430 [Saprospiraceae bacterium]|nr:hypothetical protein [Saprospiraceae bacterium]